jgi:hypothetical protein
MFRHDSVRLSVASYPVPFCPFGIPCRPAGPQAGPPHLERLWYRGKVPDATFRERFMLHVARGPCLLFLTKRQVSPAGAPSVRIHGPAASLPRPPSGCNLQCLVGMVHRPGLGLPKGTP